MSDNKEWLRSPLTKEGYESCIGSGFCCKKVRCWIGARVHGPGDNCPSLVYKDGRYWCGEILRASGDEKERLINDLHVGAGCCASLNTDRQVMLHQLRSRSTSGS